MPRYDFRSPRLYVEQPLAAGAAISLTPPQAHYLKDVLRLGAGDTVLAFNGRDGEWQGGVGLAGQRAAARRLAAQTRPQTGGCDLHYLFAPLKRARLDYMAQKAVEMGVARLAPVMTRHTQAERVNVTRMRANAIEAAGGGLDAGRLLVFCDEDAPIADPVAAIAAVKGAIALAVLIGPEGGFA